MTTPKDQGVPDSVEENTTLQFIKDDAHGLEVIKICLKEPDRPDATAKISVITHPNADKTFPPEWIAFVAKNIGGFMQQAIGALEAKKKE